jgi:DNA-binding SARP family transcriptional activator
MGDLQFRLLGPLEVLRDGAPVALPPGLPRALVGRLLVSVNTAVATDRLIEDLWRGDPPASAGHALRVYVSNLRRLLEPNRAPDVAPRVLVTRPPGYLLAVAPQQTDAGQFELLVAEGGRAFEAGRVAEASTWLAEALGLWRGSVLADLGDGPFVAAEAARLEELRWVAAQRWADAELALGRHTELVGQLEALIRVQPFRERLWAQLIVALYRSGRQADALHTYQRLRALLVDELGLEPSPPLRQLEAAVLRHDPDLAVPAGIAAPSVVTTAPENGSGRRAALGQPAPFVDPVVEVAGLGRLLTERTPFVGREAERAELQRLMEQTKAGVGALVMVGGEPGVGKSRLADELRQCCAADGFATLIGHCYEAAGAPPYVPVVEAFEQALAASPSPEAFRQFLGDEAPEITKLVPKLRQVCRDIPPPLELPAEQERRYLFNSVFEVLARTAAARPTLLVVDDIHWADEPTMLLLAHIAERIAEIPVLVVGLYRDSELDAGRPLSRTFVELVRRRLARRLRLERLPADGVAQMLTGLASQEPPPQLVEAVYAQTEGNPFFTEEVFRHLAEEDRLFDADGRFRSDLRFGELDVPEGVRLVVAARLLRLGDYGVRVLGSAAVLGRVFSFELLQALEELPESQLLDIVDEAARARLIAAVDDASGEDAYIFGHELIRQTVLSELSAPRRRRLHARTAEALERHYAAALAPQAATIANHLLEAGPLAEPKRTFRALVMAGRHALETAAYEEAQLHLERAAERVDAATPEERAELLHLRASAERNAGHWPEAIPIWHQAVDAYEVLGDEEAVGRVGLDAAYSLLWAGRWGESAEMAERALAVLGDGITADRARLLAHAGAVLHCGEAPFEVGEERLRQGLGIADQLGDPLVRGHCLHFLCISRFILMHQAECAEAGLEAAELLRAAGDLWGWTSALGWTTIALVDIGRFDEALRIQAEHEPLAERLGNHPALMQARRVRTMVDFCIAPDLAALEAYAHADVEFVRGAGLPWFIHAIDWIGLARFLAGNWDTARAPFEEAFALDPPSALNGLPRALLFEYLAYTGDREAALALLDEADDNRLPKAGEPNGWGKWIMLLSAVEGLYVLGERDRAAGFYDLVVECIERTRTICPTYNDMRLPQRTAGIAAAAGCCWDKAEEHFRTALRQATELPHLPEAAHTRRFFAAMFLERDGPGDRAEAAVLIEEARELYRSMGMPKHAAMLDAISL